MRYLLALMLCLIAAGVSAQVAIDKNTIESNPVFQPYPTVLTVDGKYVHDLKWNNSNNQLEAYRDSTGWHVLKGVVYIGHGVKTRNEHTNADTVTAAKKVMTDTIYTEASTPWKIQDFKSPSSIPYDIKPVPMPPYFFPNSATIIAVDLIDGRIEVLYCEQSQTMLLTEPPQRKSPIYWKDIYTTTLVPDGNGFAAPTIVFDKRLYRKEVHKTVIKEVDETSYEWE